MPYVKNLIKVKVPKRSGFDKSHRSSGTALCGTLVPLMCDEVIPSHRCSLRLPISVQMPPLVSETYMNVKYKVEAFFVPSRLLVGSFEDFFCDFPKTVGTYGSGTSGGSGVTVSDIRAALPVFQLEPSISSAFVAPGSLLDYLGFKVDTIASAHRINPLPLVAYHLIWQEWYRNPRVQQRAFVEDLGSLTAFPSSANYRISSMPYKYYHRAFTNINGTFPDNTVLSVNSTNASDFLLADGKSIFELRQRNFGLDYFTGARVSAQQGNPSSVTINIPSGTDSAGGSTTVSIAALRAANSLQQFRERNNIPSSRLVDQVKARYGATLSDGIAQRPICIGSATYDVVSRGVDQTAPVSGSVTQPNPNPFSGVASQYGRGGAAGSDFIINDFVSNEPGYIMVLGSLVPEVTYSSGIDPMFHHYLSDGSVTDMACSLLQNVGDQPIFSNELINATIPNQIVFGYTDRYADFMFKPNQCHGLMRAGQSLDSFILQRGFLNATLSSSFLEIPTTYLDDVLTVASSNSGLSYWYDAYFIYKVSMPLAEYSIPSLQDPAYEHGSSVYLRRNGQIF